MHTANRSAVHGNRAPGRRAGSVPRALLALGACGLVLTGCSLHVSKHGISGNILGHNFSGATGALPAGFPSSVPVPDHSRVLGGGGVGNDWDVAFAVTGTATAGTAAYQAKLTGAGFTISNVHTGSTTVTAAGSSATSTTLTVSGSTFTAADAQWTVQVASGTTSSSGGTLRPGEFAINLTVVPTSSVTSTT
jgi:hypothetical protein